MKKSLICMGVALMSFTNVALAAEKNLLNPVSVTMGSANGTPLCLAISKGDVEVVKKFIEYGASVNESSNGMTPLMMAARYNNVEIMKLLVEKGANTQAKDEKGFTALKHAQNSGAKDAVAYLQEVKK